jgi:glycyl-tRNA synthetase
MSFLDYVDPEGGKKHHRFSEVASVKINLLDRHVQLAGKTNATPITLGDAVQNGIVDNETIGYFIARIQLFLIKLGLHPDKIRFREHMENEMGKLLHVLSYLQLMALTRTTPSFVSMPSF